MDPMEVVIGAFTLFEGGGSHLPLEGVLLGEESNVDGATGVVLEGHHTYLEDEGGSFPSPRPSTIRRLSSGLCFSFFFFFFCSLSLFPFLCCPFVCQWMFLFLCHLFKKGRRGAGALPSLLSSFIYVLCSYGGVIFFIR